MASLTIIYWRDIPAQVVAKAGRSNAKRKLSSRFQEAIDSAAMADGASDNDAYLAAWHHRGPEPCGDDLEAAAEDAAAALETAYDDDRLATLIKTGGRTV